MVIDPPSGWMYGFPMPVPIRWNNMTDEERKGWMITKGYPASEVDFGYDHCRSWFV